MQNLNECAFEVCFSEALILSENCIKTSIDISIQLHSAFVIASSMLRLLFSSSESIELATWKLTTGDVFAN